MDSSRIGSQRPYGPLLGRKLGDRSPRRERSFVLPRRPSDDDSEEGEESASDAQESKGILAPQPPADGRFAVSRERLEDEAGQRIDLRG